MLSGAYPRAPIQREGNGRCGDARSEAGCCGGSLGAVRSQLLILMGVYL